MPLANVYGNMPKNRGTNIKAECYPDFILLPNEKFAIASRDSAVKLAEWLDQHYGNGSHVIAVTVHPGGEQAEMLLYDMCLERNIRLFTHRVELE